MSRRVSKKLVPALQDIVGAIMVVNAIDPQIATVNIFLEAVSDLPHFIVLNKVDAVTVTKAQETREKLGNAILASILERRGLSSVTEGLKKLPGGKIAVLGIFNSGKTSLINILTGEHNPAGDIPGTTLELTEHKLGNHILIDTVGQVVDVSKPLMVSIDLSDCNSLASKVNRCLTEDADGLLKTIDLVTPQIVEAVKRIVMQDARDKKVVVVGAGASALVAMEMAGQAQETGLPCLVFTNNYTSCQPVGFAKGIGEDEFALSEYACLSVEEGDVAIAVSASGGTAFVYRFLELARSKGAFTIAITENIDTPLGKAADIIIKSEAKPEGPSSSKIQIAHLAIGHALILTVADIRGITASKSIEYMLPNTQPSKKVGIK